MPRQITAEDLITLAADANTNEDPRRVCREFVARLCGHMSGIGQDQEARQLADAIGMPHLYPTTEPTEPTDWSAS